MTYCQFRIYGPEPEGALKGAYLFEGSAERLAEIVLEQLAKWHSVLVDFPNGRWGSFNPNRFHHVGRDASEIEVLAAIQERS